MHTQPIFSPNCSYNGSKIIIRTKEPIPKDTALTISYGPLAVRMPTPQRQLALKDQYFFTCECGSCLSEKESSVDGGVPTQAVLCGCGAATALSSTPCLACGVTLSDTQQRDIRAQLHKASRLFRMASVCGANDIASAMTSLRACLDIRGKILASTSLLLGVRFPMHKIT